MFSVYKSKLWCFVFPKKKKKKIEIILNGNFAELGSKSFPISLFM